MERLLAPLWTVRLPHHPKLLRPLPVLTLVVLTGACSQPVPLGDPPASEMDAFRTRVVDVGNGLCTISRAPATERPRYMVFDAGLRGRRCVEAVQDFVVGDTIDLFVISHPDTDHLGGAPGILEHFAVRHIVRTGFARDRAAWLAADSAIKEEARTGATVHDLSAMPLIPGDTLSLGDARVTWIAGWGNWSGPENAADPAILRNVISIVLRVDYKKASILFTGDTIGRGIGDPASACGYAEAVMVDNHELGAASLRAKVIVAPHHGADNGSARCFIEAVAPSFVVFSAGRGHGHPTEPTAQRYLDFGVPVDNIFRTDRGDDEDNSTHWAPPGTTCGDVVGDDDVEISFSSTGYVSIYYVNPAGECGSLSRSTSGRSPTRDR